MAKEKETKITKVVSVTVDVRFARSMLVIAGFNREKVRDASDEEIFDMVLAQLEDYGGTASAVF